MGACISVFSNQFKTCCRAEICLKTVQVITLLLTFIVQSYIYRSVSKKSACWVFSCFRKSTELWHRLQDISRAYVIILMRANIYMHTGGWAQHRQRVSTTFLTRQIHRCFLCSWRDSNSGHWCHKHLSSTLYQLSHPVTQQQLPCQWPPHNWLGFRYKSTSC